LGYLAPSEGPFPLALYLILYFFLPDPKFGCQPAAAPFWLGAAAMVLIFSFLGFLDSRLLLAMTFSFV
jgi:hypothetical protein